MRLAFLTLEEADGFVLDDPLAVEVLRQRGVSVEQVPWRRYPVEGPGFDAVIVRSTWDYQHDLEAFLATLDRIQASGTPIANAPSLIRWNATKTYFQDLAARGVPTVPTVFGRDLDRATLGALPSRLGASAWVLKPTVGANADDTFRLGPALDEATTTDLLTRFAHRGWMAQPFVDAVVREGEFSLFYFDGIFSHAVRKRPKPGDFRVQEEHGGHITALDPDPALHAAGESVLAALNARPLQARVDLVRLHDGTLALMELEAIEPSLYFRMHPEAPHNFARAVLRWLAKGPTAV